MDRINLNTLIESQERSVSMYFTLFLKNPEFRVQVEAFVWNLVYSKDGSGQRNFENFLWNYLQRATVGLDSVKLNRLFEYIINNLLLAAKSFDFSEQTETNIRVVLPKILASFKVRVNNVIIR